MKYLLDTNTCIRYINAAVVHNLILITHNTKEFSRIGWLKIEDWE